MDIVIPYAARPAFVPFHQRTQRDAVIVAHRRQGKTVSLTMDLILRCLGNRRVFPPPRYAFFYPSRVRAKDIAWPYLKYYTEPIPGRKVMESELSVEFPNKGRVTLYGADGARGVGLWLDGVTYDEDDDIPQKVASDIEPALADHQGWTVHAGMLRGRHNLWKRYEAAKNNPGIFTMIGRASETGIIPEAERARLMATMGETAYRLQMECDANASVANAIYGPQMDGVRKDNRIGSVKADPSVPLMAFADVGHSLTGDDWAWWLVQFSGRDILLLDYYANTGQLPSHYAGKLREWEHKHGQAIASAYLPHDGKQKDQMGKTTQNYLQEAGVKSVKVVQRTPRLWDSINHLRALMPRVRIDLDGCGTGWKLGEMDMPSGIDCLDFYTKKEDASTGVITDVPVHNKYSHGADSLRTMAEAHRTGMIDVGLKNMELPQVILAGWNAPRPQAERAYQVPHVIRN